MKYISFVVPSYNSQDYLHKCIDSLLPGGEDVEIIIVNDGSKDSTLAIANEYKEKYPTIVKVIDKENGGHGSGVNAGMKIATGIYYKCVDSDDWVDLDAYMKLLNTIKNNHENNTDPDLIFTNYVFERIDLGKQYVKNFINKKFPKDRIFTWKEAKKLKVAQFLMMHMFVYKLDILKESKLELPEKTFYVDSLYVYQPLKYVKTLQYLDVDFYRYFVGRPGQSVTYENMTRRYAQQVKVMTHMVLAHTYEDIKKLDKRHRYYIMHDLIVKLYMTSFYIYADHNKEKNQVYKEFWKTFKENNRSLYYKLRYRTYFIVSLLLIKPIRIWATVLGYKKLMKTTGWN